MNEPMCCVCFGQSVRLCAECAVLALKLQPDSCWCDATAIVCGIAISNCVCRLVNLVRLINLS